MTTHDSGPGGASERSQTILLVEDDQDVSALIRQLLVEDGYTVQMTDLGEEAQTLFDPETVDLVILDAMLPGISGWELCQQLKSQQRRPYVPIMLLTARAALQDRVRGLEAGADDYLTKPFDIDELLAHVRAMLRIRRAEVRLWQYARELEAHNAIAAAVSSSFDLKEILSQAITLIAQTARATAGAIWLADYDSPGYALMASFGLAPDQLDPVRRLEQEHPAVAHVVREGTAVSAVAGTADDVLGRSASGLASGVLVPLRSKEQTVGLLALASDRANGLNGSLLGWLTTVAVTVAVAADHARLYEQTRRIADTDALTGLYNHRYLQDAIESEIQRALRSHHPFVVMMIDLDNFKAFNDVMTHPVGDQLLRDVARMLQTVCRKTDVVGRYGGDEFILLLPETDGDQAEALATRLREGFVGLPSTKLTGAPPVSLSIGIAVYPFSSAVRQELIKAADLAMYQAKRQGGGQSALAGGVPSRSRGGAQSPFAHLETLVNATDGRTGFSRAHAEWTARYAAILVRRLGLAEAAERAARIAGLLHDVGNIGIPAALLNRSGPLTTDELDIVKQHVILSEMLIQQVPFVDDVLQAVIHHHERWDGAGYPRGLKGEEIPILGRILMIASAFAAMRSPRPFRPALSREDALAELRDGAGTQFDPAMVDAFVEALGEMPA